MGTTIFVEDPMDIVGGSVIINGVACDIVAGSIIVDGVACDLIMPT